MAQQGSGPPQSGPSRSEAPQDEDLPSWAIPQPARPSRSHRASPRRDEPRAQEATPGRRAAGRNRAQASRARRTKRRLVTLGGLAAVAALVAVLVIVVFPGSKPASTGLRGFVTTYQKGELRSVPSACGAVSGGTLSQYLPGKLNQVDLPGLTGKSSSQCDWTLDHKPMYRLLEVTATAYAPSGLASGDGSATAAATDVFAQDLAAFQNPPKRSGQPKAQINSVSGLGKQAFSAFQVIMVGAHTKAEVTTDRITVEARYRNVLIAVEFSGIDHARQGGYGPVNPSSLQAGAVAAARDVLQKLS